MTVLVTSATGSSKISTTLAALLNEINAAQPVHVITLEDPIEFVHPKIKRLSAGGPFAISAKLSNGLRAALRQAPRDHSGRRNARSRHRRRSRPDGGETGHLFSSTLHTISAGQSINRILGLFFSLGGEEQLHIRLADTCAMSSASVWRPK